MKSERKNIMSMETALFASHARGNTFTFGCALECKVGAYSLAEGDGVKVVREDWSGLWHVYVEWAEGSIGRLTARDVNKLAGREVIGEPICTGIDSLHCDDPACAVHGHWVKPTE